MRNSANSLERPDEIFDLSRATIIGYAKNRAPLEISYFRTSASHQIFNCAGSNKESSVKYSKSFPASTYLNLRIMRSTMIYLLFLLLITIIHFSEAVIDLPNAATLRSVVSSVTQLSDPICGPLVWPEEARPDLCSDLLYLLHEIYVETGVVSWGYEATGHQRNFPWYFRRLHCEISVTPAFADPNTVNDRYDVLDLMPLLFEILNRCLVDYEGPYPHIGGNVTFHGLVSQVPLVLRLREVHWPSSAGGNSTKVQGSEAEMIALDANAVSWAICCRL